MLFAAGASAATLLGPALTTDFDFTNSPEAKQADQILQERRLTQDTITETFIVTGEPGAVEDPDFVAEVNTFLTDLNGSGDRCLPSTPGGVPADRGAGRRSTGGGTRPDPISGRVGGAVHG